MTLAFKKTSVETTTKIEVIKPVIWAAKEIPSEPQTAGEAPFVRICRIGENGDRLHTEKDMQSLLAYCHVADNKVKRQLYDTLYGNESSPYRIWKVVFHITDIEVHYYHITKLSGGTIRLRRPGYGQPALQFMLQALRHGIDARMGVPVSQTLYARLWSSRRNNPLLRIFTYDAGSMRVKLSEYHFQDKNTLQRRNFVLDSPLMWLDNVSSSLEELQREVKECPKTL